MSELKDWNLRFVVGYPGTPAMVLAMRRGEIDGFGTANLYYIKSLYRTGNFMSLAQIGQLKKGKIVPRSSFAKTPTLASVALRDSHHCLRFQIDPGAEAE